MPNILGGLISISLLLSGAFAVLRWLHILPWSWLWVLSPLWLSLALLMLLITQVVLFERIEERLWDTMHVSLPDWLYFPLPFSGSMALTLIVLQWTGAIRWPWVWVIFPLWLTALLLLVLYALIWLLTIPLGEK